MRNKYIFERYIGKIEKYKWVYLILSIFCLFFVRKFLHRLESLYSKLVFCLFVIYIFFSFMRTKKGKKIMFLSSESIQELRNVSHPTMLETFYTTILVIFLTIFMSLVVFGIDKVFFHIIEFIISIGR